MTKDEWDRLPFIERYELVRGLCDIPEYVDSDSARFIFMVEQWIAHRDLRDEYVKELCLLIVGYYSSMSGSDLWLLVTATPSERCLAAYNVLEAQHE
jgi:hypothetical protein